MRRAPTTDRTKQQQQDGSDLVKEAAQSTTATPAAKTRIASAITASPAGAAAARKKAKASPKCVAVVAYSYQKGNAQAQQKTLVLQTAHHQEAAKKKIGSQLIAHHSHNKNKKKQDDDDDDDEIDDDMTITKQEELGHEMTLLHPRRTTGTGEKTYGLIIKPEKESEKVSKMSSDYEIEKIGMGLFQRQILVAAGLCFASDSMEVLLLSFLSVVLQAKWGLSADEAATLTSSVFLGAMIGTLVLGSLRDTLGRKPVFTITAAIIAVFGFATAAANNFGTLILFRCLVGFGVGGLTIPFDTLAEFVPTSSRGTNLMLIEYFWTFGTLITPVLAYFTLGGGDGGAEAARTTSDDDDAWRYFVVLCAVPCVLSTVVGLICVPESPRWLLAKGKHDKALSIMRHAAARNGKNPNILFPNGTKLVDEEDESEHNVAAVCHLFAPEWRRKTILLWIAWAGFAFVYYGNILIITLVFSDQEDINSGKTAETGTTHGSYSFDYGAIMTSASAELAGTTLVIFIIDRFGRVPTQVWSYVSGGCIVFALCIMADHHSTSSVGPIVGVNRQFMMLLAFLARMAFMASTCSTWIATAELLTTEIRATGHATSNAMARIGGSLCPYLVASSTPIHMIGLVMLGISLITAVAVGSLPETVGKSMGSASSEQEEDGLEAIVRIKPKEIISHPSPKANLNQIAV